MKKFKTQQDAFDYLRKNQMLVGFINGNSMPFDKTTNYIGMVTDIENHQKLFTNNGK